MINICHTIASLHPNSGGPARTVTSLCAELSQDPDFDVSLITQSIIGDPIYFGSLSSDKVHIASTRSNLCLKSGKPLKNLLDRQLSETVPDIIHDHGIWLPSNHAVAGAARMNKIPLVIHPRGMLEPWALSFRATKKSIAWGLYQHSNLKHAALLFATSQAEAESFRSLKFTQPIAVIPNGVDLPDKVHSSTFSGIAARERNVLFMSRIHPKKGLKCLLEAWKQLGDRKWKLILAGPDEEDHLREVLAYAKILGIEDRVVYKGAIEDDQKSDILSNADLFVLPSFSENFGVVVAEALAFGVPVIATSGTPWGGLVEERCGWWVDAESDSLAGSLREAMALTDEQRHEMGVRGIQYARKFNWTQIARETSEVYRWLLGDSDCPDCVRLD